MLLTPVEERIAELREARRGEALDAWQQACSSVTTLAKEQGLADGDLASLTRPLTTLKDEIASAPSIDAAIARKAKVEEVARRVSEGIIGRINDLVKQNGGDDIAPVKQISTIRPASYAKRSVLENETEVDAYLDSLRTALLGELSAGNKVRIE